MRHARTGKKLGRDSAHRKALYSNLTCSLIEHGRIRTTEAKAKAVKPFAEQMITLGRRGDLHARRQALAELRSQEVVHKLFADVGPRMADRPGGYSRIVKLGHRARVTPPRWSISSSSTSSPQTRLALSRRAFRAASRAPTLMPTMIMPAKVTMPSARTNVSWKNVTGSRRASGARRRRPRSRRRARRGSSR